MRRILTVTVFLLGLTTAPSLADPGIQVDYYNGWMRVTLNGTYAGSYFQVWRSGSLIGEFAPLTSDYTLCTGDCSILVQEAVAGTTYFYRFDLLLNGAFVSYGPYPVTVPDTPMGARAIPNPSRATTRVDLSLPGDRRYDAPLDVVAQLIDPRGRSVRTFHSGPLDRGITSIAWDGRGDGGRDLGPGIYFLRMTSPLGSRVSRIVRLGP